MRNFVFVYILSFTFINGTSFIAEKTAEKIYTQCMGFIKFAFRLEEERSIYKDVSFYLYTRSNPITAHQLYLNDFGGLKNSNLNLWAKTIFVIHGYTDHKDRDIIINLRNALLGKLPANVIVVDWKRLAGLVYVKAASHALKVGKYVGQFLQFLEYSGIKLSEVHLIGHSLGAQISGIAGGNLGGRIGRITGLDPAGPLFEFIYTRNISESLDETDAIFVDIIHTAGNDFGVMLPIGHVDFYPNEGTVPQPGCVNFLTAMSCSHIRSIEFFTESMNGSALFLAQNCKIFMNKTLPACDSRDLVPMGYFTPKSARGNYYLQTNPDAPYSMEGKFYERSDNVV